MPTLRAPSGSESAGKPITPAPKLNAVFPQRVVILHLTPDSKISIARDGRSACGALAAC